MAQAKTPIKQGVLQGDMDAAGYRILNLDLSGLASGAPFYDDTALIRAAGDATKLARFNISANTTGTQRIFTLPNYNGQLATLAGAEGFANKTYNGLTVDDTSGRLTIPSDRHITFGSDATFADEFTTIGAFAISLTATNTTALTLPTSGTLATTSQIPVISDVAYDATTWNGNLDGATKNAIRDVLESSKVLSLPFSDATALIKGSADTTKLVRFEVDGLTTATTRVVTMPDKDGTMAMLDDVPDFAGILFDADQPDRQLYLAGNAAFFGPFTLSGGFLTILNVTDATELTLPTAGTLATRAGAETLTNKTISGGSATGLSGLSVLSGDTAYSLAFEADSVLTSNRSLSFVLGDANRTLTLANNFTTAGNFALTLTTTAATNVTLPITGTLATLAGAETLTNKAIVGGTAIGIETFSLQQFGPYALEIFSNGDLGADRSLSISVDGADRAMVLAGDLTLANNFTTAGDFALTLTQTGTTNVTLPTSGTLANWVAVPATASSAGTAGQMAYQTGFLYVCIAPAEWQRAVLASW